MRTSTVHNEPMLVALHEGVWIAFRRRLINPPDALRSFYPSIQGVPTHRILVVSPGYFELFEWKRETDVYPSYLRLQVDLSGVFWTLYRAQSLTQLEPERQDHGQLIPVPSEPPWSAEAITCLALAAATAAFAVSLIFG